LLTTFDTARSAMNRELALSLHDEISRKHQEGIKLDAQLRETEVSAQLSGGVIALEITV
jgi:hypothetical protein